MGVKRNSLKSFAKNFDELLSVDKIALRAWTLATLQTLTDAQTKAPVASGTLEGSGDTLRAVITPKGVQSAVLFKVPYASKLNNENADIKLKDVGQLSYYVGGTKVNKRRKGVLGFLNKSVKENENEFTTITKKAVSKSFLGI